MKINNTTKGVILAQQALIAVNPWQRMKGLLGENNLPSGGGLVIKPCNSIHTWLMRFSIDVLFLDKAGRVIKALPDLKPFSLTPLYFNALLAVELPAGVLKLSGTSEGDMVSLEE